jgi:hypothetical protein
VLDVDPRGRTREWARGARRRSPDRDRSEDVVNYQPEGVPALFGIVQLALMLGAVVPLAVGVLAVVLFVPRQRRRATADDARRLHDLARVGLIGSGLAAAALLIGRLVTSTAGGASFVSPVSSLMLVVAVLSTVVAAVLFFVVAPAPRD